MQSFQSERYRLRPGAALMAALLAAALAACVKPADPQQQQQQGAQGAGEKQDSTIARAEQKATEMKDGVKSAGNSAAQSTERAATDVSDKVKDAAITSAVNAKLAEDKGLSAMSINVDTVNGRVSLRGAAPDAPTRERAQTLASTVDGVVSVDNQLVVGKG
jgi:osmotically-inducible protein OsmY